MLAALIGGIGAAIGAIGTAISTAVATVGPAVAAFATKVAAKLPAILETAKSVVSVISGVVSTVASVKGIIEQDERVDEIGAKMMQDGTRAKMPEESTEDYLNYLRNEVKLDNEKYAAMTESEKLACEVVGTSVVAKVMEEKSGVELTPDFVMAISKANLDAKTVEKLIDSFERNKIASTEKVTEYLSNELDESEVGKVGGAIKEAISEANPEMSAEDIQKEISDMKKNYNSSEY